MAMPGKSFVAIRAGGQQGVGKMNQPLSGLPLGEQRLPELQQIAEALQGLRYGTVTIIVQDGVIVQIDRTEKKRLRSPGTSPNAPDCR